MLYQRTSHSRRLRELKNIYQSQPMFVVGNGPSLRVTPLDQFVSVPSIGTNKINLIFDRTRWRPDIILCMNRHVLKQQQEWYTACDIPVFYSWQSRWFLDVPRKETAGFFLNLRSPGFSQDISIGIGISWTVTYAALQFAYYMGADPVILVGVDHRFSTRGRANKLVASQGPDLDHFDPGYFPPGTSWNLPDLRASEEAYRRARTAYEASGRRIVNATIGSDLDIFDRITIDEAVDIASRYRETADAVIIR
jgi:hypothetical protein